MHGQIQEVELYTQRGAWHKEQHTTAEDRRNRMLSQQQRCYSQAWKSSRPGQNSERIHFGLSLFHTPSRTTASLRITWSMWDVSPHRLRGRWIPTNTQLVSKLVECENTSPCLCLDKICLCSEPGLVVALITSTAHGEGTAFSIWVEALAARTIAKVLWNDPDL